MAIVFDAQGNLVDTEGRINFSPEGSDVLPPNPFLSPGTADDPYANLLGLPANQDMGYLYGVPQRADDQGYFVGLPGTADDVFPFEPPGTADDRIANLIGVSGTADDVFPFAAANRLQGLDLNRFKGVGSLGVANEDDEDEVENIKKSGGITDLFGFLIPGFNFLKNIDGKSYERFTPGSNIKNGIYSLGTFNQPVGMVNDFYDPITNTNRFDRAAARYKATGSVKDLFASSRTGAEFFNKLKEQKAAKQKALEDAAKKKRDFNTASSNDRPSVTGTGDFATFDTSGKDYGPFSR